MIRKFSMKNLMTIVAVCCAVGTTFSSCAGDDDLSSTSIFQNDIKTTTTKTDFDRWLETNYVKQYNISYK